MLPSAPSQFSYKMKGNSLQILSGQIWIDRRNNSYTVVTIAKDIQTEDVIVVYKQNFGQEMVLCCPKDAFMVSMKLQEETISDLDNEKPEPKVPKDATSMMLEFLDTNVFDEKVRILKELYIRNELTNTIIDNMAASMDFVIEEGDLNSRYDQLRVCVETRARYESNRLR